MMGDGREKNDMLKKHVALKKTLDNYDAGTGML